MTEINWHEGFKKRRVLHQISLNVMAELMGVDVAYLEAFERGECNLNITQLEKACLLFGCRLSELSQTEEVNSFDAKDFNCETLEAIIRTRRLALRLHFIENA